MQESREQTIRAIILQAKPAGTDVLLELPGLAFTPSFCVPGVQNVVTTGKVGWTKLRTIKGGRTQGERVTG